MPTPFQNTKDNGVFKIIAANKADNTGVKYEALNRTGFVGDFFI